MHGLIAGRLLHVAMFIFCSFPGKNQTYVKIVVRMFLDNCHGVMHRIITTRCLCCANGVTVESPLRCTVYSLLHPLMHSSLILSSKLTLLDAVIPKKVAGRLAPT